MLMWVDSQVFAMLEYQRAIPSDGGTKDRFVGVMLTHPKFNIAPENIWLETTFLLGRQLFRGYV